MEAARLASVEDLDTLHTIGSAIEVDMIPHRGGSIFFRHEMGHRTPGERVAWALESERCLVIAGTFDDVVFGYAVAEIVDLDDGSLLGRLHDMAVEAEARDVGIGEAMMDMIVAELTTRGCVGVDAWALPGDRATKNFFESFGLKARLLTAHRAF